MTAQHTTHTGDDVGASLQDVFASFARFGIHGAKTPTAAATPGSAGGKPVSKGGGCACMFQERLTNCYTCDVQSNWCH